MSEETDSEEKSTEKTTEANEGVKLWPCPHCGTTNSEKYGLFDESIKMASHVKYECEKAKQDKEKKETQRIEKKIEAAKETARPPAPSTPPAPTPEELSPRQRVAMYGPSELEKLKRETLGKFLSGAPMVGKKLMDWILQQWDLDSNVREDPNYLNDLLRDAGIPAHIGYRAGNLLVALDEEMRDVLDQRGERFRIPRRREHYGGRDSYSDRGLYERHPPYRDSYRDERFSDERPLRRVRDGVWEEQYGDHPSHGISSSEEVSWRIEREVEKATKPLLEKLDKLTEEMRDQRKPQMEQMVEIWRPKTDNDGQLMTDAAGKPILERINAPASIAERFMPKEDPEVTALKKIELYRSLNAPQGTPSGEELTLEKVRQVIKEEKEVLTAEKVASIIDDKMKDRPSGVNPDIQKMQDQMDTLTKELQLTKDKMTQDRFDALSKQLEEMRTMVRGMTTGEFKDDGMRILAKSIDTATDLMKTRKPLEKAMDKMMPDIPTIPDEAQPNKMIRTQTPAAAPPPIPKPVTEEAKKGPLTTMQKLGEEGYVVKK